LPILSVRKRTQIAVENDHGGRKLRLRRIPPSGVLCGFFPHRNQQRERLPPTPLSLLIKHLLLTGLSPTSFVAPTIDCLPAQWSRDRPCSAPNERAEIDRHSPRRKAIRARLPSSAIKESGYSKLCGWSAVPQALDMAALCEKCGRRHLVAYQVEPKEAWRLVVQDRWHNLCPSSFDAEAERLGVRFQFRGTRATSWGSVPGPSERTGKKQR
jgi:hypothetical protein